LNIITFKGDKEMNNSSFILAAARLGLAAIMLFVLGGVIIAQEQVEKLGKVDKTFKSEYKSEFCSNNWSNGDKVSVSELRNTTLPASGSLSIDGGKNGGIKVVGENRSDILLLACIQAWGADENAARGLADSVRIGTNGVIKAVAAEEHGWSVSYEARVPRNTNLKLNALNGGISIKSVEGDMEFQTTNGGVGLSDVAGSVNGRTTNGGVSVKLYGNSWKGSGLNVETTNGGVSLAMSANYAANIETGTVNGGFRSDIPALDVAPKDTKGAWAHRSKEVKTAINGGGAPIRVITRNGGINISALEN
jgi:hypothetical protein